MKNAHDRTGTGATSQLLLKHLLTTAVIHAPDQEIVYRDELRYNYRELERRIHRLAGGLAGIGIGTGDTVAIFDDDSHRLLECLFAIPMMGAVLQMVNWRLSRQQLISTINHAEARVVIVNSDLQPLLDKIAAHLPLVENIIVIGKDRRNPAPSPLPGEDSGYEELLAGAPDHFIFPELDENTSAVAFSITGRTGGIESVDFTHRQLLLHTLSLAVALSAYDTIGSFRASDVFLPLTPMFHLQALGLPYVATMIGAKQVYPGRYDPPLLQKLIKEEKVTFSHCLPTVLQMIISEQGGEEIDFSGWKVIAGPPLSTELAERAHQLGITVFTGYDMSDASPLISLATPKNLMMEEIDDSHLLDIVIRTGLPIPLAEAEVVDTDGTPLPHDGVTTGELLFRAPWLAAAESEDPARSGEGLRQNGWLPSGDIGHIDHEGYLQVTDRLKDGIQAGGEWISALDLENCLHRHPAVLEAAAIGVGDGTLGEKPLVAVTLKPDQIGLVDEAVLLAFMREEKARGHLPPDAMPDRILVVDTLPKTSVGKLNKRKMRTMYPPK